MSQTKHCGGRPPGPSMMPTADLAGPTPRGPGQRSVRVPKDPLGPALVRRPELSWGQNGGQPPALAHGPQSARLRP